MSRSRKELELALGAQLNALLSAARVLTERSAAAFQPGLQPAAFHVARWLLAFGPAKPSEIAEAVGMDRSSISALIREMKGFGLAASEQDAADKRAVIVSLTPLGKERVRAALDLRGTEYFSRIDDWSNDDIARFTELLRRFNR
ncbi:MarR family transcriptional regulator [Pyxidicoccus parkwayensis]|uniref:MarR family transcriptional regulator n=1 Tax=Pyxidicoccus parkwayensis TaxID=2813578 RepID=A0ABX7NL64_9BACT|nr:MarR family transcriptional regulator [Pyxidicoccus parkwaysis]QSQ19176.1 MarR family transcriptional regulator [Pyxidicoccus parkwaysis]